MTTGLIATAQTRISNGLKHEYGADWAYCRETVNAYEATAKTYVSGSTVLGKSFVSSAAVVTAGTNTGNGVMGTVTPTGKAQAGIYTVKIVTAATNAGEYIVINPRGVVVGYGTVAVAQSGTELGFTLADGSTDFAVGDSWTIAVDGAYRYKRVEASATDGSDVAVAIYVSGIDGNAADSTIAATTATSIVVVNRGPAIVAKEGLAYGTSINTTAEKNLMYSQLERVGIICLSQV